jgi:hypothetical protein
MDVGSWIPHFFYDLIGRIVPGALVLGTAFLILRAPEDVSESVKALNAAGGLTATLVVLAAIVASYTFSALLRGIRAALSPTFWRGHDSNITDPGLAVQPHDSYKYDAVLCFFPSTGARLAKLRAEQQMAWILVTGFTILAAVYVLAHPSTHATRVVVWTTACLLGIAFGAYCLSRHLRARYRQALCNNWHLLIESGKYRFGPKASKGTPTNTGSP